MKYWSSLFKIFHEFIKISFCGDKMQNLQEIFSTKRWNSRLAFSIFNFVGPASKTVCCNISAERGKSNKVVKSSSATPHKEKSFHCQALWGFIICDFFAFAFQWFNWQMQQCMRESKYCPCCSVIPLTLLPIFEFNLHPIIAHSHSTGKFE